MKRIYALRHAKAVNGAADAKDFDRALAADGREAAGKVAAHLQAQGWKPEIVLVSPALRTVETWSLVEAALGECDMRAVDKLYLASAGEIFQVMQDLPESVDSAMLVGHNPGLQHFCTLLAGHGEKALKEEMELSFPTAALAILETDGAWSALRPGMARLMHFLSPT